MKKTVCKVITLVLVVLMVGCVFSMPAYAASDIPDCNGDKVADVRDLVHLKKAIAASSAETQCDLNRDGKVDASDCIALRQYILGISEIHMNEDVADDIF